MGKKIKKALILISICLAILLSVKQIYEWVSNLGSTLTAVMEGGPFTFPDGVDEQFKKLKEIGNIDTLTKYIGQLDIMTELKKGNVEEEIKKNICRELNYYLIRRLPESLPFELLSIKGCWEVAIKNHRNLKASSTRVVIPNAIFVSIVREDGKEEYRECSDLIDLGDMMPNEEIKLTVWTSSDPRYLSNPEKIKLTCSEGVGKITIMKMITPFWWWLSFWWEGIGLIIIIIIVFIILWILFIKEQNKTGNENKDKANMVKEDLK